MKNLKTAPIDLDKPRNLGFTFKALAAIEAKLGEDPISSENFWTGMNRAKMHIVVWAGLLHESPELTLDQVEEMMEVSKMPAYAEAIQKAWIEATPSEETDPQPPTAVPV